MPALLVTHGRLGDALLEAAQRIVGALEGVDVLSNDGLSRDALTQAVRERVRSFGPGGGLLFVDVAGGSCAQAALGVAAREAEGPMLVITGVNLPMLLDFAHHRGDLDPRALASRLAEKAQAAVVVFEGRPAAGPPA
ncbi:MAG: PTS mannose transporter subunit IIAB [Candidatus Eisenbacteria bacterium]